MATIATIEPEVVYIALETVKEVYIAPVESISEAGAKAFIYQHESGNEPCKIYGGAVDCNYQGELACGVGQSNPCSKLRSVCSLSDYECQDNWFTDYVNARYGGWVGAYDWWVNQGHNWY